MADDQSILDRMKEKLASGYLSEPKGHAQDKLERFTGGEGGELSRVFDKMDLELTEAEYNELASAQAAGPTAFGQFVCSKVDEMLPVVLEQDEIKALSGDEATIKSNLIGGLFQYYGSMATSYAEKNNIATLVSERLQQSFQSLILFITSPTELKQAAENSEGNPIVLNADTIESQANLVDYNHIQNELESIRKHILQTRGALENLKTTNTPILHTAKENLLKSLLAFQNSVFKQIGQVDLNNLKDTVSAALQVVQTQRNDLNQKLEDLKGLEVEQTHRPIVESVLKLIEKLWSSCSAVLESHGIMSDESRKARVVDETQTVADIATTRDEHIRTTLEIEEPSESYAAAAKEQLEQLDRLTPPEPPNEAPEQDASETHDVDEPDEPDDPSSTAGPGAGG